MSRMVSLRKEHPALANGKLGWIDAGSETILAFLRSSAQERLIAVHNLCPNPQDVQLKLDTKQSEFTDLITNQFFAGSVERASSKHNQSLRLNLHMSPYQYLWLL